MKPLSDYSPAELLEGLERGPEAANDAGDLFTERGKLFVRRDPKECITWLCIELGNAELIRSMVLRMRHDAETIAELYNGLEQAVEHLTRYAAEMEGTAIGAGLQSRADRLSAVLARARGEEPK